MKILAKLARKDSEKYFQTLRGHTEDALKILKSYIEKNNSVIEQFCRRWNLEKSEFIRSLFLTVYLHDIGKITEQFQNNIREGKHSQHYPHALYGFYLLSHSEIPQLIDAPIELAAILGHHTQLYSGIYESVEDFGKPRFLKEDIIHFIKGIENVSTKLGFDSYFKLNPVEINEVPRYRTRRVSKYRKALINQIQHYPDKVKLKSIFTYLFSILQICDDYASVAFSKYIEENNSSKIHFDSVLRDGLEYVPVLEIHNPIKTILGDNAPYLYQKEIYENASPFSILFAPCGRGKTEAALLWALKIMRNHNRNKIIFAMPTQTTSNAMYDRLCKIFGENNVGLFHGRSYIKLKNEKINEDEEKLDEKDIEEIKGEVFKGNVFFKPITITTIDHLIYSFVHGFSQADFALGNVQNAVLIFDEVHYYEKSTLEHLITLFIILNKMNIPHLLMSGTLPEFIKRKVEEFGNYRMFTDSEGLNFRPFYIRFENEYLIEDKANKRVLNEIKNNYEKGLNQFIILNTVERAINFYKELVSFMGSDKNIILYHSQFIFKDRVKKENDIMEKVKIKPFILVATQVIEVSLDISCDVMYTELAPPDALGQRAGRLNRKGKVPEENGIVHQLKVFLPPKELPYNEDILSKSLENLNKFLKACSYKDIKDFCDSVYDIVYQDNSLSIPSNLKGVFEICSLFGYSPAEIAYSEEEGKIIQVREEKYQKVEVIPESIFNELGEKALSVEYMAKVPLWWVKSELEEFRELIHFYVQENVKGKRFRICTFPYSYSVGFERTNESSPTNII
jgi:CRISPR-associated endonuclease/helicase Cas3